MAGNSKYIRRRELAISNLLVCDTIEAAAAQTGIATRTLHGWLREPAFQKEFRQAKSEILFNTVKNLTLVSAATTDNLHDILINSRSDAARVAAARLILEYCFKGHEIESITQEFEEIREEMRKHNAQY